MCVNQEALYTSKIVWSIKVGNNPKILSNDRRFSILLGMLHSTETYDFRKAVTSLQKVLEDDREVNPGE